jgi:hypothetical protein
MSEINIAPPRGRTHSRSGLPLREIVRKKRVRYREGDADKQKAGAGK